MVIRVKKLIIINYLEFLEVALRVKSQLRAGADKVRLPPNH